MLTMVEVRTDQGALLGLPLQDISEGYVVAEIEGLDPVKATIVSSSFALIDGEQYQSSRREKRNIRMTLGLEPDYATGSVQQLRSRLYTFFMPKSRVYLRFYMANGLTVEIEGRVESFDSQLFTQEPEVVISILCFKSEFYDPTPVVVNGFTTEGVTEMVVDYAGTVETGFLFSLTANRDISVFTIHNRTADAALRSLEFIKPTPLVAGTVLEINTVSGDKRATLAGTTGESVLYAVSPYSTWLNLYPGRNYIRVAALGAAIPYTITYTNKYGGL